MKGHAPHVWVWGVFPILDTVSVLKFTMTKNQTAQQLWTAIQRRFEANKAPRAIFLCHTFHTLTQGDMSIENYGKVMKKAADTLTDVDHPRLGLRCFPNSLHSTFGSQLFGQHISIVPVVCLNCSITAPMLFQHCITVVPIVYFNCSNSVFQMFRTSDTTS